MKHTEGTSPDRSADQLEVLREQREKLAGRADRRDPSPDIAREKPVEALQSVRHDFGGFRFAQQA